MYNDRKLLFILLDKLKSNYLREELKRHQTYLLQLDETVFSFSVAVIGSGLTTLRLAGLVITGGAMLFISFS